MKKTRTFILGIPIVCLLLTAACDHPKTQARIGDKNAADSDSVYKLSDNDELMAHFQSIRNAIVRGDATAFASLVHYPIVRDYPLRWIEDSSQLVSWFKTFDDDSLKNMFKDIKPQDWECDGWRGYTIGNGDFWDDGAVYQINYYSNAELEKKEELIKEELSTLDPSLRQKDIIPFKCFYDGNSHYVLRLDRIGDWGSDKFRMCVYKDYHKLRNKPDLVLDVDRNVQGSAAVQWFECYIKKKNSKRELVMEFYIDYTESLYGINAIIKLGKKEERHKLYRVYWLDLINVKDIIRLIISDSVITWQQKTKKMEKHIKFV